MHDGKMAWGCGCPFYTQCRSGQAFAWEPRLAGLRCSRFLWRCVSSNIWQQNSINMSIRGKTHIVMYQDISHIQNLQFMKSLKVYSTTSIGQVIAGFHWLAEHLPLIQESQQWGSLLTWLLGKRRSPQQSGSDHFHLRMPYIGLYTQEPMNINIAMRKSYACTITKEEDARYPCMRNENQSPSALNQYGSHPKQHSDAKKETSSHEEAGRSMGDIYNIYLTMHSVRTLRISPMPMLNQSTATCLETIVYYFSILS